MAEVYLLLGSNKGNREEQITSALRLIEFRCGTIKLQSSLYETEAWGLKEQAAFLNKAVLLHTNLSPVNLLEALKYIEREIGRSGNVTWGPREIDIDILFYNTEIVNLPELKIPHPYLHQRRFTLVPLNEIACDFLHPELQKTINHLLKQCTDTGEATLYHC
jgi:2-amino-4-hydroxy-6-hydroxymethyldihydropteridine diphosphokinase